MKARLAAACAVIACSSPAPRGGGTTPATPPATVAEVTFPEPRPPATLRLGDDVLPTRQELELEIDPAKERYRGRATIDLAVAREVDQIWLNGKLDVTAVTVGDVPAKLVPPRDGVFGVLLGKPLAPGPARLVVDFWASAPEDETSGAFRRKVGDDWFLFTDFEPMDARMAFPAFDQPKPKIPWLLRITVPEGIDALSNQPVAKKTPTKDGRTVIEFAPSPPLSTYFVSFAVGKFASAERDGLAVVFPRAWKAEDAAFTLEELPKVRDVLASYFGRPYPYAKLDLLAVPGLGPGAMENPGLITFKSQYLLRAAHDWTLERKQYTSAIGAHELAHQWFGDLVTMAWWDDLWLNESFATWAANLAVEKLHPDWRVEIWSVDERKSALDADAVPSIRRIRQPVHTEGDAFDAFDAITYEKGGAVLRMFERWVGAEAFQKGVQLYLERHEHGNATSDDFLAALGDASGKDVKGAFSSFLDQSGAPVVAMSCRNDTLALAQRRYFQAGVTPPKEPQLWKIPVCVRTAAGKQCHLLETGEASVPVKCGKWLAPNADAVGYYHAVVDGPTPVKLDQLTAVERIAWGVDAAAQLRAGHGRAAETLATLRQLARDADPMVVDLSITILRDLGRVLVAPGDARWAAFVRDTYGARARKLGWKPRAGESVHEALLRPRIMVVVGDDGGDAGLAKEARVIAEAWLDDRASQPADVVPAALQVAAAHGDEALFDRLLAALRGSTDQGDRRVLLETFAHFRAPELVARALELLVDPSAVAAYEYRWILWPLVDNPAASAATYDFVRARFDDLAERVPSWYPARFPETARHLCDADRRDEVRGFFTGRTTQLPSGERVLTQILEEIGICHNVRLAHAAGVAKVLEAHGGHGGKK